MKQMGRKDNPGRREFISLLLDQVPMIEEPAAETWSTACVSFPRLFTTHPSCCLILVRNNREESSHLKEFNFCNQSVFRACRGDLASLLSFFQGPFQWKL